MFLVSVAPRLRRPTLPTFPADFNVYYSASTLVRHGQAAHLYQGADTGADPQKALAPPGSALFQVASAQGLTFVGLYVYPPLLADLLLPYTFAPLPLATHLWLLSNGVFLALTALLTIHLLRFRVLSWQAALLTLSLACFTPALQCLVDGQITIFLLLLWALGMLLYQREHERSAGAVFALATAIKLTPAIVLLPFLIWRKWRVAGAFVLMLLLLAAACVWIDTPQSLHTFVFRVLPSMSGAIPVYSNYSLPSSVQRFITLLHTGTLLPMPAALPPTTVLAGRIASTLVAVLLLLLVARTRRSSTRGDQVLVLALLSLLAPVLSPVSWFHAYSTAFLAFAFLWRDEIGKPSGTLYLLALTLTSLLLGSAVAENLIPYLLFSGHVAPSAVLHFAELLLAIGVIFHQLWRLPATLPGTSSDQPPAASA